MAETRKWVDLLPVIEFAVNNTPNRTIGYTAFYLNYGFHPLHPLQLFTSPRETKNELVVRLYIQCSALLTARPLLLRIVRTHALFLDSETQPPNEGLTVTDHNKRQGADSTVAYIYNQM